MCIYIQSILIIQGFHICKFTDLLKFIYKHFISTHGTLPVIHIYVRSGGEIWVDQRGDFLSTVLKCYMEFLCVIRREGPSRENLCQRSIIQAWVMVPLTTISILMKQQCILNKVSLHRNIHNTRYVLMGWWTHCNKKLTGTSPWMSPGAMIEYLQIGVHRNFIERKCCEQWELTLFTYF